MTRDTKGRFVPGYSGNPGGMSKGTISLKRLIKQQLGEPVNGYYLPDGLPEGSSWGECIVHELLKQAILGHLTAARLLIEYCDGKPTQAIQMTPQVPILSSDEATDEVLALYAAEGVTVLIDDIGDDGKPDG